MCARARPPTRPALNASHSPRQDRDTSRCMSSFVTEATGPKSEHPALGATSRAVFQHEDRLLSLAPERFSDAPGTFWQITAPSDGFHDHIAAPPIGSQIAPRGARRQQPPSGMERSGARCTTTGERHTTHMATVLYGTDCRSRVLSDTTLPRRRIRPSSREPQTRTPSLEARGDVSLDSTGHALLIVPSMGSTG
jgi:hypothetical protein